MNNNKIKPVFKFDKEVTQIPFSQARCLLTISVGQEVHEGDKFAATTDLVREHFAACTMLIDDTLQRHTMVLNHSATADDFMSISRREGDQWLIRNQNYYQNLNELLTMTIIEIKEDLIILLFQFYYTSLEYS